MRIVFTHMNVLGMEAAHASGQEVHVHIYYIQRQGYVIVGPLLNFEYIVYHMLIHLW